MLVILLFFFLLKNQANTRKKCLFRLLKLYILVFMTWFYAVRVTITIDVMNLLQSIYWQNVQQNGVKNCFLMSTLNQSCGGHKCKPWKESEIPCLLLKKVARSPPLELHSVLIWAVCGFSNWSNVSVLYNLPSLKYEIHNCSSHQW